MFQFLVSCGTKPTTRPGEDPVYGPSYLRARDGVRVLVGKLKHPHHVCVVFVAFEWLLTTPLYVATRSLQDVWVHAEVAWALCMLSALDGIRAPLAHDVACAAGDCPISIATQLITNMGAMGMLRAIREFDVDAQRHKQVWRRMAAKDASQVLFARK